MKNPFEGMGNKARALVAGVALAGVVHEGVQAQVSQDAPEQTEQAAKSADQAAWATAIPAWVATQLPFMDNSEDMLSLENSILQKFNEKLATANVGAMPLAEKNAITASLLDVMRTLKKLEVKSEGFYARSYTFDTLLKKFGIDGVTFESQPRAADWVGQVVERALGEFESVRSPEEAIRFEALVIKDFGTHLEKALQEGPYNATEYRMLLDKLTVLNSKFETLEHMFQITRTGEYARLYAYVENMSHRAEPVAAISR